MRVLTDEDYYAVQPCEDCEKCYIENIWYEYCCDERQCIYQEEYLLKENELIKAGRY